MISEFLAERLLRDIFIDVQFLQGESAFFICDRGRIVVKIEKRNTENLPAGAISDSWEFTRPMEILSDESGRLWVERKIRSVLEQLRGSV